MEEIYFTLNETGELGNTIRLINKNFKCNCGKCSKFIPVGYKQKEKLKNGNGEEFWLYHKCLNSNYDWNYEKILRTLNLEKEFLKICGYSDKEIALYGKLL